MTTAVAKKSKDSLGDRIKNYEQHGIVSEHMKLCPLVARMDGRGFSKFTDKLARPYDERLSKLMVEVTRALVAQTHAIIGYTQSDEITLVFGTDKYDGELLFTGKHDKIVSTLASTTTGLFNRLLPYFLKEKSYPYYDHEDQCGSKTGSYCTCNLVHMATTKNLPMFDARVFSVPNWTEAANALVWREQDATRNSVSMAARAHFSHDECDKKNRSTLMDMLHEKGINWNDYPAFFKRGTYVKRQTVKRFMTPLELERIPEPQRTEMANNELIRSVIVPLDMPPYSQIEDRVTTYFERA